MRKEMSKKIKFPSGHIGVVSDKVAEVLAKRKDHKLVEDKPEQQNQGNKR
jgi:hypothetical protein